MIINDIINLQWAGDKIPWHPDKPSYPYRPERCTLSTIIIHKTGSNGAPGLQGAINSARYCIEQRNWPTVPYHFWIPTVPDRDNVGRIVVYQLHRSWTYTYHSGKRGNREGISIGVQGRFASWHERPTDAQYLALEVLIPQLQCWFQDIAKLRGHWEYGKPVCPGRALKKWVKEWRQQNR